MFDFKGQGALEYLLLIGGAVLVAVIVVSLILSTATTTTTNTQAQLAMQTLKLECDGNVALFGITPTTNLKYCSTQCNTLGIKDSKGTAITGCTCNPATKTVCP
jgi:uncharacterized protein (UPF0333 family)